MNKLDKLIEWMQDEIKDYEETMPSRSFTRSKVVLALTDCINKAKKLQTNFNSIQFQHIYRKDNARADHLSNIALNLCF